MGRGESASQILYHTTGVGRALHLPWDDLIKVQIDSKKQCMPWIIQAQIECKKQFTEVVALS